MIYVLLANLLWILYACIDGFTEAFYWHFKIRSNYVDKVIDLHPFFATQRIMFAGILSILSNFIYFDSILSTSLFFTALGLSFSFFHNGCYYLTRNRLDKNVYKKGWFDFSTTSTAKLTKIMTPINRTIMFLVSIFILIYTL